MNTTAKYEMIWIGALLLLSILLFAVLTSFQFGQIPVVIDGNTIGIESFVLLPLTFLWIYITVIGTREIKHKYRRKTPVTILLIGTAMTIIGTGFFLLAVLAASLMGGLIQSLFKSGLSGEFYSPLFDMQDNIEWIAAISLTALLVFEILLIIRVIKNRKEKRQLTEHKIHGA